MKYRRLGNTGLQVSTVGLGGNAFGHMLGRTIDEASSIACVNRAIEMGITFIDTADMYGKSKSEEHIGKAVKGKRHEVVIATKFGSRSKYDPIEKSMFYVGKMRKGEETRNTNGSRDYIMEAVDASLKRLQTDYIDLYQMHSPDPLTPIEETLRALDDLVKTGKVRYIGCSNYASW
jgi:1-deoxyxylulose-5-phosphate synthase